MLDFSLLLGLYMTEESDDDEETNVIVLHKLEWRSDSKSDVIIQLCIFVSMVSTFLYP